MRGASQGVEKPGAQISAMLGRRSPYVSGLLTLAELSSETLVEPCTLVALLGGNKRHHIVLHFDAETRLL